MPALPASYGPLLRTPGVGRALATSLLGRIGQPAAGLAVVLLTVERTGSYASGGAVSASYVAGAGLGSVLWSRLVDRGRGARRVLLGTALLYAAGLTALVVVRSASTPVLAGLTALAALFTAPVTPVARALWPVLLPDPPARAAMYSLEATVQELVFITGPSLAGTVAALVSPAAAVLASGAAAVAGVVAFAASPGLVGLGAMLVLTGALVAPALAGIYTLVEVSAPAGAVTQTFAGLAVSLLSGSAAGSALAGMVVQGHGSGPAFLLGAVPPALAAVLTRLTIARSAAGSRAAA